MIRRWEHCRWEEKGRMGELEKGGWENKMIRGWEDKRVAGYAARGKSV